MLSKNNLVLKYVSKKKKKKDILKKIEPTIVNSLEISNLCTVKHVKSHIFLLYIKTFPFIASKMLGVLSRFLKFN